MIAVIYDPATGLISNTIQGTEEIIAKNGAYLPVSEWRMDYDVNYMVKKGKLVLKTDAEIEEHSPTPPTGPTE